jgi:hypothetical protein
MIKGQATRPDFFMQNLPEMLVKDAVASTKGASESERQLYALSQTSGWAVLKMFIGELKESLDLVNAKAIAQGAPFEEIGKNTVVVNMSKAVIDRILTKVSDATDACEKTNE